MAFRVESINVPSGGYGGIPSPPANRGRGGGDGVPNDLFYAAMALLDRQQNAVQHQSEMKTARYVADKQFAGLEQERASRTKAQDIQNRMDESLSDVKVELAKAQASLLRQDYAENEELRPFRKEAAKEQFALQTDMLKMRRASLAKYSAIKDNATATTYFKLASRALNTMNEVSRVELARDLTQQIRKGQISMEKLAARFPQIDSATVSSFNDPSIRGAFKKAYGVSLGKMTGKGLSAREIVESIAFKNELGGMGPFGLEYLRTTPGGMSSLAEAWGSNRKAKNQQFQDANRKIETFMPGPRTIVAKRQFRTMSRLLEQVEAGDTEAIAKVEAMRGHLVAAMTEEQTFSEADRFSRMDAQGFANYLRGGVVDAETKIALNPAFDSAMAPHRVGVALDAAEVAKNAAGIMSKKPDTLFYFADVVQSLDVNRRKAAAGDENAKRFVRSMEIQFPKLKEASIDVVKNAEKFPGFVQEALESSPAFAGSVEQMQGEIGAGNEIGGMFSTEALFDFGLDDLATQAATTQPMEGQEPSIPLSSLTRMQGSAAQRYADLLKTPTDVSPFNYSSGGADLEGLQQADTMTQGLLEDSAFAPPAGSPGEAGQPPNPSPPVGGMDSIMEPFTAAPSPQVK